MKEIRDSIRKSHKPGFRVVQYAVLSTHLHLVVEANDRRMLGRAIGGLKIRIARRLNKLLGLRGKLFSHRYHSRPLTTPRETRIGLLYVLNNARKHAAERGRRLAAGWIDPCSSGAAFDGWIGRRGSTARASSSPEEVTAAPRTWLLRVGWRRGGLLDPNAVPGGG